MSTVISPPEQNLLVHVSQRKARPSKSCGKSKCCAACKAKKIKALEVATEDLSITPTKVVNAKAVFNPMREYGYWNGLFKGTLDF
jgi:hypothetical protein